MDSRLFSSEINNVSCYMNQINVYHRNILQLYKEIMYHEYNISKNYPDIRLFLVNAKGSETPLTDLVSVGLKWSKPSPR